MKTQIIASTFYNQSKSNDDGAYECMFTVRVNDEQVVLNLSGNNNECNASYNYDDADHTCSEKFDVELTANELASALEKEHGIENNYGFLQEYADVDF